MGIDQSMLDGIAAQLNLSTEQKAKLSELQPGQPTNRHSRSSARAARKRAKYQSQTVATASQQPQQGSRKIDQYGQAVTPKAGPKAIHEARIEQLESELPGISKTAYIFSVGKNTRGEKIKADLFEHKGNFQYIAKSIWTWIELPDGKDQTFGNLKPAEVRSKLKACGYSFSRGNSLWVCKANGSPAFSRFNRCLRVGRSVLESE